jgi:hypothetical protein
MRIISQAFLCFFFTCFHHSSLAQVKWQNVDALYGSLPKDFHVYKTTDSIDGKPNIAYYAIAPLEDKKLDFTTDTTYKRRLTPQQFFEKNGQPLLVVNGTFFSFETNQNLNLVIRDGKLVSHTVRKVRTRAGDTTAPFRDEKMIRGAIGIDKKRKADIAWVSSDSSDRFASGSQVPVLNETTVLTYVRRKSERWKMETAIGGGPVVVQDGKVFITNEEERMFAGKAILDKHPRTCIGYTKDGRLVIMVIQGRYPGIAEGATLEQEAKLMAAIGCTEALNLDGGGSSCMLINGKETITPSEKRIQRPVPAVFMIRKL